MSPRKTGQGVTSVARSRPNTGAKRGNKRSAHLALVASGEREHPGRPAPPPPEMPAGDVAERKADKLARDLLRKITTGEILVGSTLPKEDALAEAYGVNRGVVREAVKLLEVHRLVQPVRRRGTVVLEPLHSMSPEVLCAMLVPRTGSIERRTLAGFLEVRAVLDVQMTVLAAERRTSADVKALRAALSRLAQLLDEPAAYAREQAKLPLLVARATKNPMYEMLAAFNARVLGELEASLVSTRPASREQLEGLTILVDVIERKDADTARRMVQAFHDWNTPRILASAALASGVPLSQVLSEVP